MKRPLECNTLLEFLENTLVCQDTCSAASIPSYRDDGLTFRGCLIAHMTLTLIEMQRIALYFKTPLYKIFATSSIEKNFKQTEDDLWNTLLTASFLHDIGKLTNEYIARQTPIKHHQISAMIAKKVLDKLSNNYMALEVAYAILFHHEAIDWKIIEQSFFLFSYLQETLSPMSRFVYTINHDRLLIFEQNLCKNLDKIQQKNIITQLQYQILTQTLTYAIHELMHNQGVTLCIDREFDVAKMWEPRYIAPALALYRLLYLADNRAASARSQYWFKLAQQVDWNKLESIAQQIYSFLTRRYYYIGLSAIPEEKI